MQHLGVNFLFEGLNLVS